MDRINRHFFRCKDCLSVIAVEDEMAMEIRRKSGKCICTGYFDYMGRVQKGAEPGLVKEQKVCACDDRCTCATGPMCSCACGGKNHGHWWATKTVVTVTDGIPKVTPPDEDAVARGEEYRGLVKKAYDLITKKYGEGWAERSVWVARESAKHRILDAKKNRRHSLRIKKLTAIILEVQPFEPTWIGCRID
jgi:hypothetical protein